MERVQAALRKRAAGGPLSATESNLIARWEREQTEARGLQWIRAIPKGRWREWSGRQTKILHNHADLYGVPVRDKTVNLRVVVRWLHDWLSANANELQALQLHGAEGKTGTLRGEKLEQQIILLKQQNRLLEQELAEKLGRVIPAEKMHRILTNAAKPLRAAGDRLYKRFGPEAGDILNQALGDFGNNLTQLIDDIEAEEADDVHADARSMA